MQQSDAFYVALMRRLGGRRRRRVAALAHQPAVEFARERLAVAGAEGGRAARIDAAAAQLVEHRAHAQPLFDGARRVPVAARVERLRRVSASTAAASGISAVITRSPGATRSAISASAASKPAGTWIARISGEGGTRRNWLATSVTAMPVRRAARNSISLIDDRTGVGVYPDWHDVGLRLSKGRDDTLPARGWCGKHMKMRERVGNWLGVRMARGAQAAAIPSTSECAPPCDAAHACFTACSWRFVRPLPAAARRCGPRAARCRDSRSSQADRSRRRATAPGPL